MERNGLKNCKQLFQDENYILHQNKSVFNAVLCFNAYEN